MLAQQDNKLISSFLLMIDHTVQSKGEAYTNISGQFFYIYSPYENTTMFSSPYKQLCNDTSISGANIMSGVFVNNSFIEIGQSGLQSINHYEGIVTFTGNYISPDDYISANYSIKDINVKLTNQPEWKLLSDTKFIINNQYPQSITGLSPETEIIPAIFIRTKLQENAPFALGGIDNNTIKIRAVIITDDEFHKIAICNILKNLNYHYIPMIVSTPFDSLGNSTGINYNYNNLPIDSSFQPLISHVKVIDIPQEGQFRNIVSNMAMADFEISTLSSHF